MKHVIRVVPTLRLIRNAVERVVVELSVKVVIYQMVTRLLHSSEKKNDVVPVVWWNTAGSELLQLPRFCVHVLGPDKLLAMICKLPSRVSTQVSILDELGDYKKNSNTVHPFHFKMIQAINLFDDDRLASCIQEFQTPWDPSGSGNNLHRLEDNPNVKKRGLLGTKWAANGHVLNSHRMVQVHPKKDIKKTTTALPGGIEQNRRGDGDLEAGLAPCQVSFSFLHLSIPLASRTFEPLVLLHLPPLKHHY
jgi:hypothetical protein